MMGDKLTTGATCDVRIICPCCWQPVLAIGVRPGERVACGCGQVMVVPMPRGAHEQERRMPKMFRHG